MIKQNTMIMKIFGIIFLYVISFVSPIMSRENSLEDISFNDGMYFAMVADTEHFPWLNILIESLKKYHHGKIKRIAVFDLGLTSSDIEKLRAMECVEVYDIEPINPEMKTKFTIRKNGKVARGWYTWKPAVLYQALQMFPYVLYLDSGLEVVSPLDAIFHEIKSKGYFFYDCDHVILAMITKKVKSLFELDLPENQWILEEDGISAGVQGVSRQLLDNYVLPVYKLASDVSNFEDDGTLPDGFGEAFHDQTLFSILIRKLGLKTHKFMYHPKKIRSGNKKIYFGFLKYFKMRKRNEKNAHLRMHGQTHNLLG